MSTYPYSDDSHPDTAIRTASGLLVDLADFRPGDVRLSDIATSLAHQDRYTGHCPLHPTVAQHSLAVEHITIWLMPDEHAAEPRDRAGHEEARNALSRAALMHDAAETYTSDLSAPMKRALRRNFTNMGRSQFDYVAAAIDDVIIHRFDCSPDGWEALIHEADVLAWIYESAYGGWSPSAAASVPTWLARDLYVQRCYRSGWSGDDKWGHVDGGEAAFLRRAAALGMRDA